MNVLLDLELASTTVMLKVQYNLIQIIFLRLRVFSLQNEIVTRLMFLLIVVAIYTDKTL